MLAACAEDTTETPESMQNMEPTETPMDETGEETGEETEETQENPLLQALQGSFSTGCVEVDAQFNPLDTYTRESLTFSSSQITINTGDFTDAGCLIVALSDPGTIQMGDWTLGDEVQTEDGLIAFELDYVVSEVGGSPTLTRTIVHLDANTLFLGNPTTDATRPTSLALTMPFFRQ